MHTGKEPKHTMSIFPTRVLLATDGSEDAALAAQAAAELAEKTGSELHVVHVEEAPVMAQGYAEDRTTLCPGVGAPRSLSADGPA